MSRGFKLNTYKNGKCTILNVAFFDLLEHLGPNSSVNFLIFADKLWLQFNNLRKATAWVLEMTGAGRAFWGRPKLRHGGVEVLSGERNAVLSSQNGTILG
jgi:hypothetical protein